MRFSEIAADRIWQLDQLTPPLAKSMSLLLEAVRVAKACETSGLPATGRIAYYETLAEAAKRLSAEVAKIRTHAVRKQRSIARHA